MGCATYRHGDLRRVLVDLARHAVVEGGLGKLSMRWLASRAGVSVAAPYHHFTDRGDLLLAVAERGFDELFVRLRNALDIAPPANGGPVRLLCLSEAYVRFAREQRALCRLMMQVCREEARRPHRPDAPASHCFALLRDEVRRAGLASNPRDEIATTFGAWAAMHGAADLQVAAPTDCGDSDRADDLCRRLLSGLFTSRNEPAGPFPAPSGDDHD